MIDLSIPSFLSCSFSLPEQTEVGSEEAIDLRELDPDVEDRALASDVFLVLVGCDGNYFRFSKDGECVMSCVCRFSAESFVEMLLPCCNRFVSIKQFCDSSVSFKNGRVRHALCSALQTFLSDYAQAVSDISLCPNLTLSSVLLKLQEPIEMLKAVELIVKKVSSLRGAQIISVLNQSLASSRGVPVLKSLLSFLFEKSIVPLISFVEKWIFLGVIDDAHGEFFVRHNAKGRKDERIGENFWDDRFSIIREYVPSFIPPVVADRIFATGKARSVLREFARGRKIARNLDCSDLIFEKQVTLVFQEASNELIAMFKEDHELIMCFEALKKVFLCQRGDWLCLFMKSADVVMRKAIGQIGLQDFEPHIATTLDARYSRFVAVTLEDEQLAFALQSIYSVGSTNPRSGKKGRITSSRTQWEYFSFIPVVEDPLKLIVTEAARRKYQFLFRNFLLWRRLDQKFCRAWKLKSVMREISAKRHAMHVFITAYLNYMSASVVHPAWAAFEEKLDDVPDIERLCMAHEQFLQAVMKGCFLLNEKVYKRMSYIAMICWHFAKDLRRWNQSVSSAAVRPKGRAELAEPVLRNYPKFTKGVNDLIRELRAQAERDADPLYLEFVTSITINTAFGHQP